MAYIKSNKFPVALVIYPLFGCIVGMMVYTSDYMEEKVVMPIEDFSPIQILERHARGAVDPKVFIGIAQVHRMEGMYKSAVDSVMRGFQMDLTQKQRQELSFEAADLLYRLGDVESSNFYIHTATGYKGKDLKGPRLAKVLTMHPQFMDWAERWLSMLEYDVASLKTIVRHVMTNGRGMRVDMVGFSAKSAIALHNAEVSVDKFALAPQAQVRCVSDEQCAAVYLARTFRENDPREKHKLLDAAARLVKGLGFTNDTKFAIAVAKVKMLQESRDPKALEIAQRLVAAMSPSENPKGFADAHRVYGEVLLAFGRHKEAEESLKKSADFFAGAFGAEHSACARVAALLGETQDAQGDARLAVATLDHATYVLYKNLGAEHTRTLRAAQSLKAAMRSASVKGKNLRFMRDLLRN